MRRAFSKPFVVMLGLMVGLAVLVAQQTPPPEGQPQEPPPTGQVVAPAAIAESGLLPIYGATLEIDKNWVDGKKFPSAKPNSGVEDTLEQLYTAQIAPCGFNVLRVPFDVNDGKAEDSTRLANLCVWAQQKGLKVAPILVAGDLGKPFGKDYATKAKSFVSSTLSALKRNKAEHLGAYGQIAFYQLGYPLNHPGYHGVVSPEDAADALKKAAANVRSAETSGLGESGLSPSQLLVPVSFDFELLKGGAIAGTELSPDAFAQAFESMKAYIAPICESPEVGMFGIEWFPGSVTSEATEKLPDLVRGLMTDVQGKLLVLSTGFSTGFRPAEDQSRFYALSFANLADLRASEGVESPFVGVLWNGVLDGPGANAAPPSDNTAANIGGWDLSAKAAELVQMLQSGGGDPDLAWWWNKTRSSFGIISNNGGFATKQAHEVLVELQGATAQAAVESGVAETAQELQDAQNQAALTQADPNAPPIDPNTGLPIDPNTGQPIDPNNPPIDPNTGQPLPGGIGGNPLTPVVDDLKNKLNGALSELLGGIIEKGKNSLSNLIGKFLGDPNLGVSGIGGGGIDPNSGQAIDPNTGLPIDPNTGLPIDPNTGLPIDPGAGTGNPGDPSGGGGSGGAPTSGMADLAFESPGSAPTSMTTNEPISVSVSIRNNGDTAAQGATAYLIDGDGNAFAASDQTVIQPGSSANVAINFTPPSAGSIPGVKILLFCENESNTGDNSVDVGSVTISDPPGGVPDDSGVGDPGGDPGGTTGGGTGGGGKVGGGGKIGGLLGGLRPGSFVGFKPAIGLTLRAPGISPKLTTIKPGMFNIGSLLPGSSAKLMTSDDDDPMPSGPAAYEGLRRRIGFQSGNMVPINVPVTNPFKRPFRSVKATLFVNGRAVATKTLGMVMPKQTRTVSFNEFKPTEGGNFQTEVRFDAVNDKGRPLLARAPAVVRVLDAKAARPLIRPTVLPSAGGDGKSSARPIGGLAPTLVKTSIMRPTIAPILTRPILGAGATPGAKPPVTLPIIRNFTFSSSAAIGLTPNEIGLNPFPPAENAKVSATVQLSNRGMAAAKGVKVEVFVDGKSMKSQTLDVPAGQQVVANKFDNFSATLGRHEIKVTIGGGIPAQEATKTFEVKKGVLAIRPILALPIAGSLAFTGNDIQLTPVPQPNVPTKLSVNVRNPGGKAASASFEAFADGRSLGKVTKSIGAFQTTPVDGFPSWTPPAGSHTVKVVATLGTRQIAAERNVNVATAIVLKPIVTRPLITTPINLTGIPGGTGRPAVRPTTPTGPGIVTRPPLTFSTLGKKPDLALTVNDLSTVPTAPQGDQDVIIQVLVHNVGGADADNAVLTFGYRVDTQPFKTLDLPISVKAGQEAARNWKVRLPKGSQLQIMAKVAHKDDSNAANGSAAKTIALGATPGRPGITPGILPTRPLLLLQPDIMLSDADITLAPTTIKEGDTLNATVRVKNAGAATKGAKLTLVFKKDGAEFEKKEFLFDATANETVVRMHSVKVPKASKIELQAYATVANDKNPGNQVGNASVNVGSPRIGILNPGVLPGRPVIGLLSNPDPMLGVGSVVASSSKARNGQDFKFTVKVKNGGRADCKGVQLTVKFEVDGKSVGSTLRFTLDVQAGQTVERTVSIKVPSGNNLECIASLSGGGDSNLINNSGRAKVGIG